MSRDLEPWGGEVRMPGWLRRLLHRADADDTPERAHERRRPDDRALPRGSPGAARAPRLIRTGSPEAA